MRRWVGWSAVLTLLALVGCSDDSKAQAPTATTLVSGVPVLEGGTQPPGTKLDDGFTVPSGTVLIGDVFPAFEWVRISGELQVEPSGRSWEAYLLVLGDPREVVQHFQREAEGLGLTFDTANCGATMYLDYGCGLKATAGAPSRRFALELLRQSTGTVMETTAPVSYARVIYAEGDTAAGSASKPIVDIGPDPPPLPDKWPPLPAPGEAVPGFTPHIRQAEGLPARVAA